MSGRNSRSLPFNPAWILALTVCLGAPALSRAQAPAPATTSRPPAPAPAPPTPAPLPGGAVSAPAGGTTSSAPAPGQPAATANPEVKLPPFERVTLDNGLVVLLMEQHEVPLLDIQLAIRSGSDGDPRGKEGVAELTASLLRRGTRAMGTDELAATLDFLGARLGGSAGVETSAVSAEFLVKDREQGMQLLAQVVQQPTFPAAEVTKELARMRDGVLQAKDDPAAVLGQYAARFFYGDGHPYGRPVGGDEASLKKITRADVLAFHRSHYVPANGILAVVGDLKTPEMLELVRRHFGGWKGGAAPAIAMPAPEPSQSGRVLLIDKPDAPQTHYAFVAPGMRRTDPDRTTVDVVNTLFGGRFSSWLNVKLRVEEGLTYGARSGFVSRSQPGHFVMRSFTETPNTARALELTVAQLERLQQQGPTAEELGSVKAYLKGQFPPTIETPDELAGVLITLEYYGLGREEIDGYMARVDLVDPALAQRIVREKFPSPKGLELILIGQAAKLRADAARYGTVTEKSIAAPGF